MESQNNNKSILELIKKKRRASHKKYQFFTCILFLISIGGFLLILDMPGNMTNQVLIGMIIFSAIRFCKSEINRANKYDSYYTKLEIEFSLNPSKETIEASISSLMSTNSFDESDRNYFSEAFDIVKAKFAAL